MLYDLFAHSFLSHVPIISRTVSLFHDAHLSVFSLGFPNLIPLQTSCCRWCFPSIFIHGLSKRHYSTLSSVLTCQLIVMCSFLHWGDLGKCTWASISKYWHDPSNASWLVYTHIELALYSQYVWSSEKWSFNFFNFYDI